MPCLGCLDDIKEVERSILIVSRPFPGLGTLGCVNGGSVGGTNMFSAM